MCSSSTVRHPGTLAYRTERRPRPRHPMTRIRHLTAKIFRLGRLQAEVTSCPMLIWINGPFGGGKTVTAFELRRRLPGSVVCDPEHVGFGLHRMLPPSLRGDFQDLPVWRTAVLDLLRRALTAYDGPVIVPMTVADPGYFGEIVGGLRADGFDVHHFALLAELATMARRLNRRGFLKRDTWAFDRLGYCLRQLSK